MDVLTIKTRAKPGEVATVAGYGTVLVGPPDADGTQEITIVLRQKAVRKLRGGRRRGFDNRGGTGFNKSN